MEQDFLDRGLEKAKLADWFAAIKEFDRAIKLNPQFAEAFYRRALAYFDLGQPQAAINDYNQSLTLKPQWPEALFGRSLARMALADWQGAIADAEQVIRLNPNHAAAHRLLGVVQQGLGKPQAADIYYRKAAKLYLVQQDEANCRRCLESAQLLNLPPTQLSGDLPSAQNFLDRALTKMQNGNLQAALNDFDWLLLADANDAQIYCLRGVLRAKLGNFSGAMQDLNRAMQLQPQDRQVRLSRAAIRTEIDDALGAIADFNQLLEAQPTWVEAYVGRGQAWCKLGNYREAIEDYSRALALEPNRTQIYCDRALARAEYSDLNGAINDYQQAANQWFEQSDLPNYRQCLDKIKALRLEIDKLSQEKIKREEGDRGFARQAEDDLVELELQAQLLRLVGGNGEIAQRLINIAKQDFPNMPEQWYWQKVIFDLESEQD
jgi:tetratricopeptide (TPR) repeat protein